MGSAVRHPDHSQINLFLYHTSRIPIGGHQSVGQSETLQCSTWKMNPAHNLCKTQVKLPSALGEPQRLFKTIFKTPNSLIVHWELPKICIVFWNFCQYNFQAVRHSSSIRPSNLGIKGYTVAEIFASQVDKWWHFYACIEITPDQKYLLSNNVYLAW